MSKGAKPDDSQIMPSILDKEVSELSNDAFGHHNFSNALKSLIEGKHRPPFSIGLLGSWGTGKSTIKELYLDSLASDSRGANGKKRRNRFRPITFNAWRYGADEDIKRALLRHVFIQLGGDDLELRQKLYQQVTDTQKTRRGMVEWLKEAVLQNSTSMALFLVAYAVIIGSIIYASNSLGLSDQFGLTMLLSVGSAVAVFLSKYVVDIRLKSPTLFNNQTVISFPMTSAEEYERLLIDQIRKFRAGREGRSCERLIVFVDDLDRLSAAEMVSGLDAVRTFLELPLGEETENFGVIFVISCDEDRVADALSRGRGRINPDLPGSVFTRSDARRYLDRLFQFRLEIPPFPKLDMRQFTETKLSESGVLVAEIEKGGARLQDVVERLIHVGVQSPRNAIQILNAFTQTWWIALQRERSGVGSTAPGALYDGAVSNHPLALAALCVLRVDFPDFYNELQKRPELIQEFQRVLFRSVPFESLAVGAQHALKDFLIVHDGKVGSDVRPDHRNLRQYLSSLLDLRWPKSLQPLLLLAQDAISRKYGDRAAELHSAFVSGDTHGVLEIFGHHLDNDDLSDDDVRLLEELAEGLSDDTQTRRVNAARVLAAVSDRIPNNLRGGLMVPLARQMIELKNIRMNVGPKVAKEIIAALSSADRREVAESFSFDLLTGRMLDWRLPTGQTPNLEELVSDAKSAVELVLDVRATDDLLPATDNRLKAWLWGREVQSSLGSQTLSFAQLELWMSKHSKHLLRLLGSDYSQQAIDELESNPESIPNVEHMLERVCEIFKNLADDGQESREWLWQQLTKLVAVKSSEGVQTAWNNAATHAALAEMQQAQVFLLAFASRLQLQMTDTRQQELDWKSGAQQFLDLATRWSGHIDGNTAEKILPLAQTWSEDDETSEYMVRIADILKHQNRESWNKLIDYLISKPFEELPGGPLEYVASNLNELDDAQKGALAKQLNVIVTLDVVGMEKAEKYTRFISISPKVEWSSGPLLKHANLARDRIVAMSTQAEYISAIFPSVRMLFNSAPEGQTATVLTPLFEQAAGSPTAYPILHREMTGYWPEENEQTGRYDPSTIASRALQFIKDNGTLIESGDVFRSVVDMESRDLVEEGIRKGLSDAATIIWPHSPAAVITCIKQIASFIPPRDAKKLLTGKQPDQPENGIQIIIKALIDEANAERLLAITKEVLATPPLPIEDQPDGVLRLWLLSLQENESQILIELIKDESLNEVQRERIITYAFARKEQLALAFFVEALPIVLAKTDEMKPIAVVVAGIDGILSLARNSDQKSVLATALVPTLSNLPNESMALVARAINKLNGRGILERTKNAWENMDANQMSILAQEIPGSKVIKQYQKSSGEDSDK